jgi:uncharacterized protein (DUF58 family)
MIDTSFLNQINRFDLVIKKRVLSQYSGERQSNFMGEGLVFKDYREYIPGDDFRQIDWALYARTDKYFIRRFEEEKNMALHILIDASASMDFGRIKKYEYAAMIGLGFAYLAIKNNERFELSNFSERMETLRPKKGKNALGEMLEFLNKAKLKGKSQFYNSLAEFKKRLKSKSMVIIISDFLFDLDEFEKSLQLFKRSEIYVIQVLDKEEVKFNMAGDFVLKDSEHGDIIRTFVSNRLRSRYRQKLDMHSARLKNICGQIGARFVGVTTDMPIFDTFYQVLK